MLVYDPRWLVQGLRESTAYMTFAANIVSAAVVVINANLRSEIVIAEPSLPRAGRGPSDGPRRVCQHRQCRRDGPGAATRHPLRRDPGSGGLQQAGSAAAADHARRAAFTGRAGVGVGAAAGWAEQEFQRTAGKEQLTTCMSGFTHRPVLRDTF